MARAVVTPCTIRATFTHTSLHQGRQMSGAPPPPGPPPPGVFADGLGPLLLGAMVACPLYGISIAQAIWYYRAYPADPKALKYFIAAMLILDGAHTFSLADAAKIWYLRAEISLRYPKSLPTSLFFAYITMSVVQSAYTLRVWIMSKRNWVLSGILAFLTFVQFVTGVAMSAKQAISGDAGDVHDIFSKTFGATELVSAMLCDVLISASLVFYLNKNRSGIRSTESLVDKLIMYFIGIGLLTSIFALLNLVTWLAIPDKLIFTVFHSLISKLYVNSLLVTLNSRTSFRKNLTGHRMEMQSSSARSHNLTHATAPKYPTVVSLA
ncbi:hypothetical protein HGRIS_000734 [Hohenbuehelia grisea]|uniref:DUF6534 domain-containing protein n=1 Tax=Hohenbuehelia grisea TaxID=104357 RepID=A0ABR3IPN3_9AGAR